MKIGIIGSGKVGGTLGTRWAAAGHEVVFSSRDPGSEAMRQLLSAAGGNTSAASVSETAATCEILLLATPWPGTRQALEVAGNLAGKILIDATNPLLPDLSGLEFGNTTSGAEQVASWAPDALVVKAFNTIGSGIMENSKFPGGGAALLYCGDNKAAKETVHTLAEQLGFTPHDSGPLTQARTLEPFALLWISMALMYGYGTNIAFDLMRR